MSKIYYINRLNGKVEEEKIYGGVFLQLLYETRLGKRFFMPFIARTPWISRFYGYLQTLPSSKKKIKSFVRQFSVNMEESEKTLREFRSFNDFFTRRLRKDARPVIVDPSRAVLPADGRYLFFENISKDREFLIKGVSFSLEEFLQSKELSKEFEGGSLVIARLCPTDYHRFHFPFDCTPSAPIPIEGSLYSVNPMALKQFPWVFWENKRVLTTLISEAFGKVLMIEVGATYVGSILETFCPYEPVKKGEEKGLFCFGGSSVVLLFSKGVIEFDKDLLNASREGLEIYGHMGQSMGKVTKARQEFDK